MLESVAVVMANVHVVMPIRGRKEQSVDAMVRLVDSSGLPARYYAVSGMEDVEVTLAVAGKSGAKPLVSSSPKLTYWQALNESTKSLDDSALVVNVANDVLPCKNWLLRAHEVYQAHGDFLVGFNGDGYVGHSCHFLISMKFIRELGGWPVWYHHNYGDTELCVRANELGRYAKAPWAILFHNHPIVSGQKSDSVYLEGNETASADERMFIARRGKRWSF